MSFWCLQFHPINEQKQVYLRFWEYQKVLFKLTDLYQSTIFQISFNCKSTSGLKVDPLTLSLQLWREQRSEYSIYGEKKPSQILLAYATSVFWLHSVHLSSMPWENPPLSTPNILIFNVVYNFTLLEFYHSNKLNFNENLKNK